MTYKAFEIVKPSPGSDRMNPEQWAVVNASGDGFTGFAISEHGARKEAGRKAAAWLADNTSKRVDFMEFDGKRFHFQITQYKALKIIGPDGQVKRESFISDSWVHSSELVYSEMACYPEQLGNGDALFFLEKGLTQNEHERFEQEESE